MEQTPLSNDEVKMIEAYEKGRRLRDTRQSMGWDDLLDLLEKRVVKAEYDLINYAGGDSNILFGLQRRARAVRELFEQFQLDVQATIAHSEQIPQRITAATVGIPGF